MPPASDHGSDAQAALAFAALCEGVLPVWARHLATSRSQSEVAVTEMLQAFADIGPHINRAERQSLQITEALSQSDGSVTGLALACDHTLAPLLQDASLPAESAAAVRRALEMVHQAVNALEEIAKPFNHETQMVAAQVERMYVGFQYQDRISQMMALLEGDIVRLQQAVAGTGGDAMDLQAWLDRLESQYAMAEQRQDHSGTSSKKEVDDNNETTFF